MSARNVWYWLVLNQKYIWSGLYLLAIPGFGWAYSTMEKAFYAPNMRLEQSYSEDAKKVAEAICSLYNDHRRIASRVSDMERALKTRPKIGYDGARDPRTRSRKNSDHELYVPPATLRSQYRATNTPSLSLHNSFMLMQTPPLSTKLQQH